MGDRGAVPSVRVRVAPHAAPLYRPPAARCRGRALRRRYRAVSRRPLRRQPLLRSGRARRAGPGAPNAADGEHRAWPAPGASRSAARRATGRSRGSGSCPAAAPGPARRGRPPDRHRRRPLPPRGRLRRRVGVRRVRRAPPLRGGRVRDLVLLDLGLPTLDGCRRIRKGDIQAPTLILSGRSGKRDAVRGLELGADDCVTKPFDTAEPPRPRRRPPPPGGRAGRGPAARRRRRRRPGPPRRPHGPPPGAPRRLARAARSPHAEGVRLPPAPGPPARPHIHARRDPRRRGEAEFDGYGHTLNVHINRLRTKIERDLTKPTCIGTVPTRWPRGRPARAGAPPGHRPLPPRRRGPRRPRVQAAGRARPPPAPRPRRRPGRAVGEQAFSAAPVTYDGDRPGYLYAVLRGMTSWSRPTPCASRTSPACSCRRSRSSSGSPPGAGSSSARSSRAGSRRQSVRGGEVRVGVDHCPRACAWRSGTPASGSSRRGPARDASVLPLAGELASRGGPGPGSGSPSPSGSRSFTGEPSRPESELSVGTTVALVLPAHTGTLAASAPATAG